MNNFQALDQTAFTFISIYLSTLIIIGFFGYRARQENTLKDFYLAGNGFGIEDARKAIEIVNKVRTQTPVGLKGSYHPFAKTKQCKHPFKSSK